MTKFRVARWNTGNFRVGGLYAPWGAYHATIPVGQRPSDDQPTGKDDRAHIRLIRPITPLELNVGIPTIVGMLVYKFVYYRNGRCIFV